MISALQYHMREDTITSNWGFASQREQNSPTYVPYFIPMPTFDLVPSKVLGTFNLVPSKVIGFDKADP